MCACPSCTARRRKAEALALSTRGGGEGLESSTQFQIKEGTVVDPDAPMFIVNEHSARSRIAEWVQARALNPDVTNIEVAKQMGISPRTLSYHIRKATKEGWLRFEDPIAAIEYQIIPKVIKNLNKFLDDEDRTVTIETAKGTLFRQYQDSKGITDAPMTVLALKIEQAEGDNSRIVTGHVVGRPRKLE